MALAFLSVFLADKRNSTGHEVAVQAVSALFRCDENLMEKT